MGTEFWAERVNCPYAGTTKNSPFQEFFGYEYKKFIKPEIQSSRLQMVLGGRVSISLGQVSEKSNKCKWAIKA